MKELKYKGYMDDVAHEFFKDRAIYEQRDGMAVIGYFIILKDGRTHLPSKGDVFTKDENGDITVITIYR
jgi:hypothetical protein